MIINDRDANALRSARRLYEELQQLHANLEVDCKLKLNKNGSIAEQL